MFLRMQVPSCRGEAFLLTGFRMLAAVTCLTSSLGCISYRAEQQRLAVNWIESQGGEVRYDHYRKLVTNVYYTTGSEADKAQRAALRPENSLLANVLGEHYVHRIEEVSFYESKLEGSVWRLKHAYGAKSVGFGSCNLTADVLAAIGECSSIEQLHILDCEWDQNAISRLARLPKLKQLALRRMPLDAGGLEHIGRCSRLESLDLTWCIFPPDDVRHLSSLKNLKYCDFGLTAVGDDQLHVIAQWQGLQYLTLGDTVSDAKLEHLSGLTNLESLTFNRGVVTDAGVRHLVRIPKLKSVHFAECHVSDDARRWLMQQGLRVSYGHRPRVESNAQSADLTPLDAFR
jgi:hypothetical protein